MSVVVAIVTPEGVSMACDSQLTSDHASTGFNKLEVMECGSIVGITGTPLWHTFVRTYEGKPICRGSVEAMALVWIDWAKKVGTQMEDGCPIGCLLLATPAAVLWQLCNDGAAVRIHRHIALGSGSPFALGAMEMGANVQEAVEVAITLDPYCGGRIFTASVEAP